MNADERGFLVALTELTGNAEARDSMVAERRAPKALPDAAASEWMGRVEDANEQAHSRASTCPFQLSATGGSPLGPFPARCPLCPLREMIRLGARSN